jgi:hypothetical protein
MFKILSTYSCSRKYIKCNIWRVAVHPSYIQDARFLKVKWGSGKTILDMLIKLLKFFYPNWGFPTLTGFSTMTEVFLPWLRFFYPNWFFYLGWGFLPWLRFFYPDWGFSTVTSFSTVTEVFIPWLRFFYPDWGFYTLTEVFQCFFLSCKANARVKLAQTGHGPHSSQINCVVLC